MAEFVLDASDSDSDYTSAQECDEALMVRCACCGDAHERDNMHVVTDGRNRKVLVCQGCVDGEYVPRHCPMCFGVTMCELCLGRLKEQVA